MSGAGRGRRRGRPAPLDEILAYENEAVVRGFTERLRLDVDEARDIFRETLKWLYLCATVERDAKRLRRRYKHFRGLIVTDALLVLDEMWHTFILFTVDYRRFCERYLGGYVDHYPTTWDEKAGDVAARERIEAIAAGVAVARPELGERLAGNWKLLEKHAEDPGEVAALRRDLRKGRKRLRAQMSLVYDLLGPDTVRRWYQDYPRRYPLDRLDAAHVPYRSRA